jgi:prolyl-tRNA synthetase
MMQDRKALQACTSHYLGQNFAKSSNIRFTNKQGELEHAYTTSWGMTTRLIGALVMAHGDDDGLRLPSQVAPLQVIIIPVIPKETLRDEILAYADKIQERLQKIIYKGEPLRSKVDKRDIRGGDKSWEWIKKGVPLRIEIGPKEIEKQSFALMHRHRPHKEKEFLSLDAGLAQISNALDTLDQALFQQAESFQKQNTVTHIKNFEELKAFFTPKNEDKPEIHGGFALCKWSEDPESEKMLADYKISIRCLPFEQSGTAGKCVLTGKPASRDAIFAKSY